MVLLLHSSACFDPHQHHRLPRLRPSFILWLSVNFLVVLAICGSRDNTLFARADPASRGPEPAHYITERCLLHGGKFQLTVREGVQGIQLFGAPWFDIRRLFTHIEINRTAPSGSGKLQLPATRFTVVDGLLTPEQIEAVNINRFSLWESIFELFGSSTEADKAAVAHPFGDRTLVISSDDRGTIEIQCTTVTDWVTIAAVASGLFLTTTSGILGSYSATLLVCGAVLGVLIGVAIPVLFLFNKHMKLFLTAASAGLMTYGALFYGNWLVTSRYFWVYLCISAMFGMWWFSAESNKRVVSWSLFLLGTVLLATSHSVLEHNLMLTGLGLFLRALVEMGVPQRIAGALRSWMYWRFWIRLFPNKKKMLTEEEYKKQGEEATKRELEALRLYFFRSEDWRNQFDDKTRETVEKFIGSGDHLQIKFDGNTSGGTAPAKKKTA